MAEAFGLDIKLKTAGMHPYSLMSAWGKEHNRAEAF